MNALQYLVDALLTLFLYVLILRFAMQLSRADFRNQIAHAVLVVTNPVIMPLRKVFPPIGKVDTASVLAIVIFAALIVAATPLILQGVLLDPLTWLRWTALTLIRSLITFLHSRDHPLRDPRLGDSAGIFTANGTAHIDL